ncbi:phospholipid scramblase 2-like [Leptidea sinapis]|uniref:phospholipid scramblase 2-like n=1 Tax=Leptidea sinapis TaxID=189913 RepID=UPI0021C3A404|nr:phospholipid scramblase 2-like [Leptidea sinapis]
MMMQTAPIPAPVQPINDIIKESSRTGTPETITKPQAISETYILSELLDVDRLLITKRLRVKSVVFLRGKKNRFYIRTPDRNLVYTVEEDNSWWVGYLCYGLRPMQLRVFNNCSEEIMRIDRPYACTARILPCQLQKIQVFAPPGRRIGSIEQQWTPIRPIYVVKRENGEEVFWLQGPRFTISFFRDIQFSIQKRDGTHVGSTCKRWQGILHALFFAPVTDRFGVAFERDLTVEEKALLLAATLLIDYMYYDA